MATSPLPHDDSGRGPAVVFLHSFPLDRAMWTDQLPVVAHLGRRAVAPDLPGFGEAPGPTPGPPPGSSPAPSLDAYVDAVVALLDHLGIDRATVVGLSLGGYVALALARRHPERLAALVLADTRAAPDTPMVKAGRVVNLGLVRARGVDALIDKLLPRLVAPDAPAPVRAGIRAMAARQTREGVGYALLAMRDRPDATPLLATLAVPTLVLAGEHDGITPPEEMKALAAAIPGARFETLPGAGHLSNLENPAAFNRALADFLKPLRGATPPA